MNKTPIVKMNEKAGGKGISLSLCVCVCVCGGGGVPKTNNMKYSFVRIKKTILMNQLRINVNSSMGASCFIELFCL